MLCLISVIHSMTLHLCLQSRSLNQLLKEKSDLSVDAFCVSLLLSLLIRLSLKSPVFDFNVSLNDTPPLSPMSLSIGAKRKENEMSELLMDVSCVSSFFCLYNSARV